MKKINCILILICLIDCLTVFGQYGKINGLVYNRIENQGLPNSIVRIEGTNLQVMTDFDGNFLLDSIPIGTYKLNGSSLGYCDTTLTNIKIIADSIIYLKFILPPYCKYEKNPEYNICPICGKNDEVVPIVYGLVISIDENTAHYGGCVITCCDPKWYCKRDKKDF